MSNDLTINKATFFKLLSLRSGISEKSVKMVYNALIDLVMESLQMNNKIDLPNFVSFKSKILAGGTRLVPDPVNKEPVKKYCKPSVMVSVKMSPMFKRTIRNYAISHEKKELAEILPEKRREIIKRQLLEGFENNVHTDVVLQDNLGKPIGADEDWEETTEDKTEDNGI